MNLCIGGVSWSDWQSKPFEGSATQGERSWEFDKPVSATGQLGRGATAGHEEKSQEVSQLARRKGCGKLSSHGEGPWEVGWSQEVGCESVLTTPGQLLRLVSTLCWSVCIRATD